MKDSMSHYISEADLENISSHLNEDEKNEKIRGILPVLTGSP